MAKYLVRTASEMGSAELSATALGKGGEGSVYGLSACSITLPLPSAQLVAKIYHEGSVSREDKLRAMLSEPPSSAALAWPLALLYNGSKQCVGYLMRRLPSTSYRSWAALSNSSQRRKEAPAFDVRYAYAACRNLAVAMDSLHHAGHCVGDVNESNIFVGADAQVLLIDLDSAQVRDGAKLFPCAVGKPEYTAPSLTHGKLVDHERTPATDIFAYAVTAFQMLTGGAHPTAAVMAGEGETPSVTVKIQQYVYPLFTGSQGKFAPPPRVPANALPESFRALLLAALMQSSVPSLESFRSYLDELIPKLKQCRRVKAHWHLSSSCEWCEHAKSGQPDPWAPQAAQSQKQVAPMALPPVKFSQEEGPTIRRAAPTTPARVPFTPMGRSNFGPLAPPPPLTRPSTLAPVSLAPPGARTPPTPQAAYRAVQSARAAAATPPPNYTIPSKVKGKSVLTFPDGSARVRPPLRMLARSQPRLAWKCFLDELPSAAKFYWPKERLLAARFAPAPGFFLGALISLGWLLLLMKLPSPTPSTAWHKIYPLLGLLAAAGSFIATLLLFGSANLERARRRRQGRTEEEAMGKSLARFGGVALIYGPGVLGVIALGFLSLFIRIVGEIMRSGKSSRY